MDGSTGRSISLSDLSGTAEDFRYTAKITTEAGECTVGVRKFKGGLAAFVRSLANDWAGFDGERQYAGTEGEFTHVCRHDGHGTVSCRVTIGQP